MKTYLLYQLILVCSFMAYKSYCTDSDEEQLRSLSDFGRYRTVARPGNYPYHVAIAYKANNSVLCQGVLVASNWILTSGSCFKKYADFVNTLHVMAGIVNTLDRNAFTSEIDYEVYHPEFDPFTEVNDLALIKLNKTIDETKGLAKPVKLSGIVLLEGSYCNYSSYDIHVDVSPIPLEYQLFGLKLKLFDLSSCDDVPDEGGQVMKYFCAGLGDLQFVTSYDLDSLITHVGTPLACGDQLLGIKSKAGFFTSTHDIVSWVNTTMHAVREFFSEDDDDTTQNIDYYYDHQ